MSHPFVSIAKTAIADESFLNKKAREAGNVSPGLLKQEYELFIKIEEAKERADTLEIMTLTKQLIEIQEQQPKRGPAFG